MNEIGIADFEQCLLIIRRARIGLNQVVQHVDLLVHIAFCAIAKALLIEGIVGIAFPRPNDLVIVVDGISVVAFHKIAVTETKIGIGLEVILVAVLGKTDEALETHYRSGIISLLVIDVAQIVVRKVILRHAGGRFHSLELKQVLARRGVVAHLVGRLAHPEACLCFLGQVLGSVHDLGETLLRLVVVAVLEMVNTCGIQQIVVNRLQLRAFLLHRLKTAEGFVVFLRIE